VRIRRGFRSALALLDARWVKRIVHPLRWAVPGLLIAYLAWRLTQLGWGAVWNARPGNIGFYAAVLLSFYVQPVADLVIYRGLLRSEAVPLMALLRKRYINSLFDYSGELYFFFWARKKLAIKSTLLFHAVKDTNVLSASAGLVMIWMSLLAVVASGGVKLPAFAADKMWTFLMLGSLPLVLLLALFIGGRRVTMLSRHQILVTFAIHLVRCVAQLTMEFLVWWLSGALPSVAVCLEFVALRVLVTRLPMVPSKDLVFVGIGIAAAGVLNISAPSVAAALVLMTAFSLVQNLLIVGLPWFLEQFQVRRLDRVVNPSSTTRQELAFLTLRYHSAARRGELKE